MPRVTAINGGAACYVLSGSPPGMDFGELSRLAAVNSPSAAEEPSPYARRLAAQALAARSPMMIHGAIVLPLTTRGIIDASAISRFSTP